METLGKYVAIGLYNPTDEIIVWDTAENAIRPRWIRRVAEQLNEKQMEKIKLTKLELSYER